MKTHLNTTVYYCVHLSQAKDDKRPRTSYFRLPGEDRAMCVARIQRQLESFRLQLRAAQHQMRLAWSDWPPPIKPGSHQPGRLLVMYIDAGIGNVLWTLCS